MHHQEGSDEERLAVQQWGFRSRNNFWFQNQILKLKFDLLEFDGQLEIEDFLDWLKKVENYFEYADIQDDRRVKFVTYKLYGRALVWWDQIQASRIKMG